MLHATKLRLPNFYESKIDRQEKEFFYSSPLPMTPGGEDAKLTPCGRNEDGPRSESLSES
jgi:hypothetical protein